MKCKNCGHIFEGHFCSDCGQKSNVGKINFNYLINELTTNVFQVNRGILYTIKELFTRPGHSIREFIEGKRKYHFKPLAFVLLAATIYVLVMHIIEQETNLGQGLSGMTRGLKSATDDKIDFSYTLNILEWMTKNYAYSTLILIPFFSFSTYLAFKSTKYNYFEHLILNFFVTGQQLVIYIIFALLYFLLNIENKYASIIPFALTILFQFWTFIQFFKLKNTFLKIVLTVASYMIYYILIMITMVSILVLELIMKR